MANKLFVKIPGIYYGTLIDNKIVSLASEGWSNEEGVAEIRMGTHGDYRKKLYPLIIIINGYNVYLGYLTRVNCCSYSSVVSVDGAASSVSAASSGTSSTNSAF